MARHTETETAEPEQEQEAPAAAAGARGGHDTFSAKKGKPEIAATDKAMGANMVHEMNVVNGLDGGKYDLDHGVKYDYNRERELKEAGRMDLWREEYRMGHNHSGMFINPWENGNFMRFELKKGKSASEGIKTWLAGVTIAECNSAVIAMQIDTFRKAIGDDKFDAKFGSADPTVDKGVSQRLVVKQGADETPIDQLLDRTELAKKATTGKGRDPNNGTATEDEKEKLLKPGEWYYFYNHPKYLLKHPGGAWQGENSLYMGHNDKGERMWAGMGATDKTEDTMVEEMISAYNAPRDEADEREMVQGHIKSKEGKYTIFKKYDPASGEFPDTVTADQILNDPPYKLGGVTRKGGFLPAAGMALNPKKVSKVRDEK